MEPSTKRPLVILGIVVALLLGLFIFGTARGLGGGSAGCASTEKRDGWRARLLRPAPLAAGQLGGCTSKPGTFTVAGECELEVRAADVRSRRLVVTAIDPVGLTIFTDADGRRIRMRPEIDPGKTAEIFIGKEGKSVFFRCLAGTACRARID